MCMVVDDDICAAVSSAKTYDDFLADPRRHVDVKDGGSLSYILGMRFVFDEGTCFVSPGVLDRGRLVVLRA